MPMKLTKTLLSSGALCTFLTALVLLAYLGGYPPFESLERQVYDLFLNLRRAPAADDVVFVEIDRPTLDAHGGWPLPRTVVAEALEAIGAAGGRAVGLHLLYEQPEPLAALREIRRLEKELEEQDALRTSPVGRELLKALREARGRIDGDGALVRALQSTDHDVLPLAVESSATGEPPALLPDKASLALSFASADSLLTKVHDRLDAWRTAPPPAVGVRLPLAGFVGSATALGHLHPDRDPDGVARRIRLLVPFGDKHIPSLALQLAAEHLRLPRDGWQFVDVREGFTGLVNGELKIPVDRHFRMLLDNRSGGQARRLPLTSLLAGKIPEEGLHGKLVLLGADAAADNGPAFAPRLASMTMTASVLATILSGEYLSRPSWCLLAEATLLLYLGLFLVLIIPRVRFATGLFIMALFLGAWWGAATLLFVDQGIWLHVAPPSLLTLAGLTVVGLKRSVFSEERARETAELNKMLGLSFQGQGMLDLAYEKFMKCPLAEPAVKDLMYNLALDFERKRMPEKAMAVYRHILKAGRYRDVKQRLARLAEMPGSDILAGRSSRRDATMILGNADNRPTLGRYEILKELGQGAMGTVFLGRDPKINRQVAIKTLRYADVETEQLEEVKDRFFREAEAAGQLTHPNIVTVYDVGEEQELAWLAMELLQGTELTAFCRTETRLSPAQALRIVGAVAEALDYANSRGVVHRDIKPANIMRLEDGTVKVTDFGIARVVSSSRTQTGMILGTPNYMSPEQIAGRKVDGRSDIFSLGAVLYELLSGRKAFQGEDIAALMYNITHGRYTSLGELDIELPSCCAQIVDKMLAKALTRRFKSAGDVARQIDACLEKAG